MTALITGFFKKAETGRTAGDREIASEVRWKVLAKKRIKKYPLSGEAMLVKAKERIGHD